MERISFAKVPPKADSKGSKAYFERKLKVSKMSVNKCVKRTLRFEWRSMKYELTFLLENLQASTAE